jgi:hypothetical protein
MKRQRPHSDYAFGDVVEKTKSLRSNESIRTAEETLAENDHEVVLYRCTAWLKDLNPSHRPKTRGKLCNALSKICYSTYKGICSLYFAQLLAREETYSKMIVLIT